jgi:hypothetical protein
MKNFKSSVPLLVQAKLHSLATELELTFSDVVGMLSSRAEPIGDVRLDEIEGNYVSGWMPRQDGGFNVNQLFRSDLDNSYHFTEKQTDFVKSQSEECYAAFFEDNGIDPSTWDDLTEEQKESYSEYENEWFEDGAMLEVQMYANGYPGSYWEEKEQTINIRVSINYRDAPYFRESSAEDIKQLILTEAEFMAADNAAIINQLSRDVCWTVTDEESATKPGEVVKTIFAGSEQECISWIDKQDADKVKRGGFGLNNPEGD